MFNKIKKRIDKELLIFAKTLDQSHSLSKLSPILFKEIKEFILRDGKRIRPALFLIGYLGFKKKPAKNLYKSALAIELLHDFMLVHDDIIDKSDTRRGKPSMHAKFNSFLSKHSNAKFNGQDLAIVTGDVMYAMAIHSFLSIEENFKRKEKALRKFIEAAMYTGAGEFIELILGIKDIDKTTKQDIMKVYDYKTAQYTFSCPLSTGAILAGARNNEIDKLFKYGICLGRAFQIKDDILGMFGDEKKIGKSILTDLQEAKNTLLIWYTYKKADRKTKKIMNKIMSRQKVRMSDLFQIRKIVISSGALEYAKREVSSLIRQAQQIIKNSGILPLYKKTLNLFTTQILDL